MTREQYLRKELERINERFLDLKEWQETIGDNQKEYEIWLDEYYKNGQYQLEVNKKLRELEKEKHRKANEQK